MTALRSSSPLPTKVGRAELVRNLSVFASNLQTVRIPDEANYENCLRASKAITRTLDEVIEGSLQGPSQEPKLAPLSQLPPAPNGDTGLFAVDAPHSPATSGPKNLEAGPNFDGELDALELSEWVDTIDWNYLGSEWNAL